MGIHRLPDRIVTGNPLRQRTLQHHRLPDGIVRDLESGARIIYGVHGHLRAFKSGDPALAGPHSKSTNVE